jgi:hypothetical protein
MPVQPIGALVPSNYPTQSGSAYPLNIDANAIAAMRIAANFLPQAWPAPNMTALVYPGHVANGATLSEIGAFTTGSVTGGSTGIAVSGPSAGIAVGQAIVAYCYNSSGVFMQLFPTGTIVTAVSGTSVTASAAAAQTQSGALFFFAQPIGNTAATGTLSNGSNTVSAVSSTAGMFPGMAIAGSGIPSGTVLAAVGTTTLTLSQNATASASGVALAVTVPGAAAGSPRIDRIVINRTTGAASWVEGTAGASPAPPAMPLGSVPVAQLLITSATAAITTTSTIADERDFTGLGVTPGEFGPQASIAAAATTDLGTTGANTIKITGTTAIASFGASASTSAPLYVIQFAGALTLTNGAALALPGGQNIATAANDRAIALYLGGGSWIVLDYQRANGQAASMTGGQATLAAAATTDLGTAGSNLVQITGTTTITALGASASLANPVYLVDFAGALTLTFNATSLILPGGASIVTAAGDSACFQYLGAGNWRCLFYHPASGQAVVSPPAPVVASIRNGRMYVSAAGTSGTFTADEVVVETALGGIAARLANYSGSLSLGATGAGGMDTGGAPAGGYINIYAIAGPAGVSILAQNAATNGSPSIYGGAHLPSGYTQSALLAIWPTNSSGQLAPGLALDRHFDYQTPPKVMSGVTGPSTLTSQSIAGGAPPAARTVDVTIATGSTTLNLIASVAGDATGTGLRSSVGTNVAATKSWAIGSATTLVTFMAVPITSSQTVFWEEISGTTDSMYVLGYSW